MSMIRPAQTLLAIVMMMLAMAACGSTSEVVRIGGATSTTVDRPWGTVKTFPEVQKAQTPSPAELDFMTQMITHHEQAVVLSELVLRHREIDPRITAAAQFIAQDQTNEIAAMRAWLTAWDATPDAHDGHHGHHSTMPGMVPQAKIDRLAELTAGPAAHEFVELMIFHHEGAVAMSKTFLADADNTFALSVAQHLIREQSVEIGYLRHLLDQI